MTKLFNKILAIKKMPKMEENFGAYKNNIYPEVVQLSV